MDILTTILSSNWAIDRRYAEAAYPILERLANGQPWEGPSIEAGWAISPSGGAKQHYKSFDEMPEGSIAVFQLNGPMMKADQFCGPRGTGWLATQIQEADKASNISAIIIEMDSPGGQISGTEHLANVVDKTQKPIYSLVHRACSACYWVASKTDMIWMNAKSSEVGSIGVMCSFADLSKVWKKRGIKVHEIYSKLAPNKNKSFRDALQGKYSLMEGELTQLDEIFMQAIRDNREGVDEEALDGSVFLAESAITVGLADRIGTMSDIISHLNGGNHSSNNHKMSGKNKGALGRFLAAFKSDEDVEELNRDIDALRESEANSARRIGELETEVGAKDARIAELENQNASLTERLATAEQERKDAQELAEKHGAQPGALGTSVKEADGEVQQGKKLPSYVNPNAAHNKALLS